MYLEYMYIAGASANAIAYLVRASKELLGRLNFPSERS